MDLNFDVNDLSLVLSIIRSLNINKVSFDEIDVYLNVFGYNESLRVFLSMVRSDKNVIIDLCNKIESFNVDNIVNK